MPARQSVRRKQRRTARPARQQPRPSASPASVAGAGEVQGEAQVGGGQTAAATAQAAAAPSAPAARGPRQAPMSPTRMALAARAAELARLDVIYLRHDLRNVGIIAGLMLAIIIGLSFAPLPH